MFHINLKSSNQHFSIHGEEADSLSDIRVTDRSGWSPYGLFQHFSIHCEEAVVIYSFFFNKFNLIFVLETLQ